MSSHVHKEITLVYLAFIYKSDVAHWEMIKRKWKEAINVQVDACSCSYSE